MCPLTGVLNGGPVKKKGQLARLRQALADAVGSEKVIYDPDVLDSYARDETSDLVNNPDLVVRASCTRDVSETLRLCSHYKIPVTPRGAGTGVTGGAVAVAGGVVLSLERMNRIIEIDTQNMVALVEPGLITGDLQKAALEHGLMYPPDPASLDSCSIGGNVAENAGGPRAVKYGTTKDYLLGLEFVLPDGSVITTGGKYVKNATGYNLVGLLAGSEGTLAVITRICLRLIPAPPFAMNLLIPYDSIKRAVEDVFVILSRRVQPSALEFMEQDAIQLVARYLKDEMPFPDARAHLLVQLDGDSEEELDRRMETLRTCLGDLSEKIIVAQDRSRSERIWKARRSIREAVSHESPVFLAEDTVVPRSCIPQFLIEVKDYLTSLDLRSVMFGHAGDGNVHIDVLKGGIDDGEWKNMVPVLKRAIYDIAISFGGTITGEHGIGFTRREYLPLALSGDELNLLRRIKAAFDPDLILNPRKVI